MSSDRQDPSWGNVYRGDTAMKKRKVPTGSKCVHCVEHIARIAELNEFVANLQSLVAELEGLLKEWLRTCPVERTLYAEGLARRTENLLTTEGKEDENH